VQLLFERGVASFFKMATMVSEKPRLYPTLSIIFVF